MKPWRNLAGTGLTSGAALLYALPSWAESAEGKGGLPQLDTAYYPSQLFWLFISFGLLYVLMAFVALPLVGRTQGKRKQTLNNDLETAAKANDEAKATLAQVEKALADARARAQSMIGEVSAQVAKEAAERQAAQQQELVKRIAEAEGRIAATRDAAIHELHGMAFDLANSIVEKVAGMKMPPAQAVRR